MRVNKESSRQKLTRIEFEAEEEEAANAEHERSFTRCYLSGSRTLALSYAGLAVLRLS